VGGPAESEQPRYYRHTDNTMDWWADENYPGYEGGLEDGYYDEYAAYTGAEDPFQQAGGDWENFEIDFSSMIFTLDDNLEPQDLYVGFEFDDKSLSLVLHEEDLDEQSPSLWKSRPLKIHPEPAPRNAASVGGGSLPSVASLNSGDGCTPTAGGSSPTPREALAQIQNELAATRTPTRSENQAGAAEEQQLASHSPGSAVPGSGPRTAGGQSPKIVISNSQLEHLKQKMQALKQRREASALSVLPPAAVGLGAGGPIAADVNNGGSAATVPAEEEQAPQVGTHESGGAQSPTLTTLRSPTEKPPVTSNCPGMHGLWWFRTPDRGWWCSRCQREHPTGTSFYGCRSCDYDECEACARAPAKSSTSTLARNSTTSSLGGRSAPSSPRSARIGSPPQTRGGQSSRSGDNRSGGLSEAGQQEVQVKLREAPRRLEPRGDRMDQPPPVDARLERNSQGGGGHVGSRGKALSAAAVAAAAPVAAARESGGRTGAGAGRSDDGSSPDEDRRRIVVREPQRRATRDPRLVPRERRETPTESWEMREPQDRDLQEASEPPSPVPELRRRVEVRLEASLKRRPASERPAPSSSEEPPAPKRWARAAVRLGSAEASSAANHSPPRSIPVRITPAAVRRSPEVARAGAARRGGLDGGSGTATRLRGQGGDDLLRRVLRANAGQQMPKRLCVLGGGPKDEPRTTLLPTGQNEPPSEISIEGGGPMGGIGSHAATLKPPSRDGNARGTPQGIRTALGDFASHSDRKSRRV